MANILLNPVYYDIYNEHFSSGSFSKRMKMQKLVYLLQEAGLSIGDYNFYWYKYGPYSQQLQNDILSTSQYDYYPINYSETAKVIISKIKQVLNMSTEYSEDSWAECLASLQYLRTNVFSMNTPDDEIIEELQKRKPHLDNQKSNYMALRELKTLY